MSVVHLPNHGRVDRPDAVRPGRRPQPVKAGCGVVLLNDGAVVFDVLAETIRGTAVGWSDVELAKLEAELQSNYGSQIGGTTGVRKLIRLACSPFAR